MTATAQVQKFFEVTFNKVSNGGLVLDVAFFGQPPPPATVDKILRSALDSAILVNSSNDILAMAFVGDEAMNENQYFGELVYKAADKRVLTWDEYNGVKKSGQDTEKYYIETKEDKTLEGITPAKRWLDITLVYSTTPSIQDAYDAAVTEATKASSKGLDENVYVSVGDKNTPTSWMQLEDSNTGKYVFIEYKSDDKTISSHGKILKQLK
ncbi:MAG TPA: hypothetical protein VE344_03125 [Methylomirabilota bacterium]|nr:hypothetical protein [Methylomirabilota bacterium]